MKIYLCHKKTGKYYSENGEWIKKASAALSFATVPAARQQAAKNGLKSATVVLRGHGLPHQMALPVEKARTSTHSHVASKKSRRTRTEADTEIFTKVPWLS
jgi:hypothetical protein